MPCVDHFFDTVCKDTTIYRGNRRAPLVRELEMWCLREALAEFYTKCGSENLRL